MFLDFFYALRKHGLDVSVGEWMTLMEGMEKGLHRSSFSGFYHLARAIVVKSEAEFDKFDQTFAEVFKEAFEGVGTTIRMGGDEFVAIIRTEHLSDLNNALKKMVVLEKDAKLPIPVALNVAYGFSVRRRGDAVTAMDVYRMADANMYAMKLASKQQRMA